MTGAKKSTWIGGTVFVSLVIIALAYFLAISPTLTAAQEVRDQAQSTRDQNDLLRLQVAQLAADFKKLPEYKAELADLQLKVPTDARLADYLRALEGIAAARAVTLISVAPGSPELFVPAAAPAPAAPAPAADGSTPTDEATAAADATVAPAATTATGTPAPEGMVAIPITLTAIGTYDNTQAFLSDLQNATARLFLVTGLTASSQPEAPASGGKPATVPGDQQLDISGFAYVLTDPTLVAVDPSVAPPALPGAVPGKNPMVPITGR
ncbi:hypothetical protein [Cellulomonas sp.]|uniref:hypothetical protein n=1 Tax=Cellulomonas sp. TaxID=40001 RepID=UPI003BAD1B27